MLRARGARGFSLIEVMTVVVIIGILTALALPQFVDRMRDRRTYQAAQEVSMVFRTARARALGRGAAQLVRYTASTTSQTFVTLEAVQSAAGNNLFGTCGPLPVTSCFATPTQWAAGDPGNRQIAQLIIDAPTGAYPNIVTALTDINGPQTTYDMCFTPTGRTFVRVGTVGAFASLVSVPTITVTRIDPSTTKQIGLQRNVLLPPNGAARLVL